jgi:hypothetical protein
MIAGIHLSGAVAWAISQLPEALTRLRAPVNIPPWTPAIKAKPTHAINCFFMSILLPLPSCASKFPSCHTCYMSSADFVVGDILAHYGYMHKKD